MVAAVQGGRRRAEDRNGVELLERRVLLSAGQLDPTFGTGGIVTDLSLPAGTIAVQADGKVVTAGGMLGNFEVARFNANGSPDTSFGYFGRLITDFGGNDTPTGAVVQADGKILVAGVSDGKFALARYLSNGQLDSAFGTGGLETTGFGPNDWADSAMIALDADGRIVMAGSAGTTSGNDIVLARYNPDASPDVTFGTSGKVISAGTPGMLVAGMVLQADHKIIVSGRIKESLSLMQRFNADGSLDPTVFANTNVHGMTIDGLAVQPDGKIVIGIAGNPQILRDNADGTVDPTFHGATNVWPDHIILMPDGKIVVSGLSLAVNGSYGSGVPAIERLNPDGGSVDPTFGNQPVLPARDFIPSIAAGPGGTIVASGGWSFLLARLAGDSPTQPIETPFGGVASAVPGRIEAENFDNGGEGVAYHDTDPANLGGIYTNGGDYRDSQGVDLQLTGDTGGGFNVGWTHAGEYLNYTVNAAASGTYDFAARVSDYGVGGAFHVEVDGVTVTGTLAIPDTGNFQSYTTVTAPAIAMNSGQHVVKLVFDGNSQYGFSGNVNWLQFTPAVIGSAIGGTVFYDTNGNGVRDPGETPLAGQQIYIDSQGLGSFVAGDPIATSDAAGHYAFTGLSTANYILRTLLTDGQTPTTPVPQYGGFYFIPYGSGSIITGKDFGITPSISTLATFNGANGSFPIAGLIADAAGNLYGTTKQGGANNLGTVFQVAFGTHALTTLVTFDGTNGYYPIAGLTTDAAGNLYGTTEGGGANNRGTVFQVAAGTHAFTTLVAFDGVNGAVPLTTGLIADAAGNLYGTTAQGGANGLGTVFKVAADSRALTTLATFDGPNGATPEAGLIVDAAGNLYGMTTYGGPSDLGTVFQIAAGTHTLTTLATFDGGNGSYPFAGLIADAAGNLYGTTVSGGANNQGSGTVFQVAAGTHVLTTLATFDGANGASPHAGVISDAAGNLYGTTAAGGANDQGTVFKVAAGNHALTTLAVFDGNHGSSPYAGLIADAAGNLYGTTTAGGPNNAGAVYQLAGTGFVVP